MKSQLLEALASNHVQTSCSASQLGPQQSSDSTRPPDPTPPL